MHVRAACALLVVGLSAGCGEASSAAAGCQVLSLLQLVQAPLLQALYATPGWGRVDPAQVDASGAYGANVAFARDHTSAWYIEEQRQGADAVEAGIDADDPASIDAGFALFDWGFAQQGPGGDFPGTGDAFHSTSFFVEAVARALVLLRAAGDPHAGAAESRYLARVHAAATWMTEDGVEGPGRAGNAPYTHRRYLVAAALGLTAQLTGDARLAEHAASFAREGLALQAPEGFNPEKGGFDVNYNAVGLVFAAHYATTLSCAADRELKVALQEMLRRGLAWQAQKVTPDGEIITAGSTRVGVETDRQGKLKTPAYAEITRAFVLGALTTGDPQWNEVAERIAAHRWHVHLPAGAATTQRARASPPPRPR